jgi:hypothetical protein
VAPRIRALLLAVCRPTIDFAGASKLLPKRIADANLYRESKSVLRIVMYISYLAVRSEKEDERSSHFRKENVLARYGRSSKTLLILRRHAICFC